MNTYDFKEAKRLIQLNSDVLKSACIGMKEDWFWTAETVYEEGKFTVDLLAVDLEIGGITSSTWATPSLLLIYKNGTEKLVTICIDKLEVKEAGAYFELGVLSASVQDYIEQVNTPKLTIVKKD